MEPGAFDQFRQVAASWSGRLLLGVLALALGFSVLARLTAAGDQPLWLDEAWTLAVASQPDWAGVIRHTWLDANAPLYYAFMHLWGGLFGFSDAAMRAPAVVFGALIPLPALLGRLPGLPTPARLAWAGLLALWLPGLWFSEDARAYALLALLCTAQTVAFVDLLDRPGVRTAALWSLLSSLAILTHYHALVLGAVQGFTYLALRRGQALKSWPGGLVFLIPFAVIAWHWPRLALFARPDVAWYGLLRPGSLGRLVGFLVGAPILVLDCAVLALAAIVFARLVPRPSGWRTPDFGSREGRALVAAALTSAAGAAIVIGLGFLRPSFTDRYLTFYAPGVLLGLVLLFAPLSKKAPLVLPLLVGLFLLVAGLWWKDELKVTGRVYNYEVASHLLMRGRPERLVFLWDHPAHRIEPASQLAEVGDVFFRRAGMKVETVAVHVAATEDPSPKLAAAAAGKRSAILWMYDRGVQGTAARLHLPHIEDFDPAMKCRNLGRGGIGIIACDRTGALD